MTQRIAIVGTRKPGIIPEALAALFQARIPTEAIVTSGNAEGVDQVSKLWRKNIQYLPWDGYNGGLGYGYKHAVCGGVKIYDDLIYFLWPWLAASSDGILRLVRRSCCTVCGLNNDQPVDAVYFYAKERAGIVSGGTRYAVDLARHLGIPTYNLKEAE